METAQRLPALALSPLFVRSPVLECALDVSRMLLPLHLIPPGGRVVAVVVVSEHVHALARWWNTVWYGMSGLLGLQPSL